MLEINLEREPVNVEALDNGLRAGLGSVFIGVSTADKRVTVFLSDAATPAQQKQARTLVSTHDPSQLTPRQQAEALRKQKLAQTRRDYGAADLDASAYDAQPALVRALAQKLAWLEQELLELRSGRA